MSKLKVEFYESAEEMPIKRFQRFNKYLMIDSEVGSDFEDYDNRTQKTIEFLKKQMFDDAVKELNNRRQMVYHAFEEYSPKHYALALLVKSIDGQECKQIHEKELDEILQKLDKGGYTQKQLNNDIVDVKKKSLTNWKCISLKTLIQGTRKILTSFSLKK